MKRDAISAAIEARRRLRACQREKARIFRTFAGLCIWEYGTVCQHAKNPARKCLIRACPLLRREKGVKK